MFVLERSRPLPMIEWSDAGFRPTDRTQFTPDTNESVVHDAVLGRNLSLRSAICVGIPRAISCQVVFESDPEDKGGSLTA